MGLVFLTVHFFLTIKNIYKIQVTYNNWNYFNINERSHKRRLETDSLQTKGGGNSLLSSKILRAWIFHHPFTVVYMNKRYTAQKCVDGMWIGFLESTFYEWEIRMLYPNSCSSMLTLKSQMCATHITCPTMLNWTNIWICSWVSSDRW